MPDQTTVPDQTIVPDRTPMLDDLMPRYDFAERHHRFIPAPPTAVWSALERLTIADLTLGRSLIALRNPGRRASPKPLLTDGPVPLLWTDRARCAVAGTVAQPWRRRPVHRELQSPAEVAAFHDPGWTAYLTDFRVTAVDGGAVLSTETRGFSTDAAARRRFALYWAVIRTGSALIRRDLLRAVARIAVAQPSMCG